MKNYPIIIIGAGASGIVAAISARRVGREVLICEKNNRLGRKILASGNGRCNLLNEDLNESYYNPAGQGLVKSIFSQFNKKEILDFFKKLGLFVHSEGRRIFPCTNQSASVLKVLELELKRLSIPVEFNFAVSEINTAAPGFVVTSSSGKTISSEKLIIATGGRTYPALGSDGSGYDLAQRFGHRIILPVPSAVPLVVKHPLCHLLQGQRISARAKSIIDGKTASQAEGEVLFTKYGLSGTAIIDISREISEAINRDKKHAALVSLDLAPFIEQAQLQQELEKRQKHDWPPEDLLAGILPDKFSAMLKGCGPRLSVEELAKEIKDKRFSVVGTRGWNESEFTSGGVDARDVNPGTLESKIKKGLYFCGEVLDVEGQRGGYNLAWAWASGWVAGLGL